MAEKIKQGGTNVVMAYITICWVSFILLGINAVNPALAAMKEAFVDVDPATIQMFSQLPALTTIPFLLLSGVLCRFISSKWLALSGLILYAIGGLTGYFCSDNFTIMLVGRVILGFGVGLLNPVVINMIADMFSDNNSNYTRLVGLNTTFKSLGGVLQTTIVGALAVASWQNAFLWYFIAVPAIIFVAIAVPNVKPAKLTAAERDAEKASKEKFDWKSMSAGVVCLLVLALVQSAACSTVNTNTSFLIEEVNGGGSLFAGLALSAFTLGAVISSLVYTKWGNKGNGSAWSNAGMLFVVAGCFFGAFPFGPISPFLATACVGIGNGLVKPVWAKQLTLYSMNWAGLMFALFMVAQNLGTTLQAATVPSIAMALGGTGTGPFNFLIMGVFQIAVLIFQVISNKVVIGPAEDKAIAEMETQEAAE